MNGGLSDALSDAIGEALSAMSRSGAREDVAARVREHYPNPRFLLESNAYALRRFGLNKAEAFYFSTIPQLARCMALDAFGDRPMLDKLSKMTEYMKALYIGVHVERFYAVMLDSRGRLMEASLIREGTTDSAPFDLKEMLSCIVRCEARAVAICHNHPRGTMKPSAEDVQCTRRALSALAALNVPMLDHIVVARERAFSIRQSGVIPCELWALQQPNTRLLRDWLDVETEQDSNFNNSFE